MIRNSIILALTVVLAHPAARSQSTDPTPPLNTTSDTATGVIGGSTESTEQPEFVPMTATERFRLYLRRTFGPGPILESGFGAGIRQWEDVPKEWKQGPQAYGDRFGTSYALHLIRGTLQYGAGAALHEDDRYVRPHDTGFWKRSKHAGASTFLARNDAGQQHFAYSRFGSAAGAAFISRIWQPPSTTSGGDGAVVFGAEVGMDVVHNMLHEFWPDVKHHVFRKSE